MCVCRDRCECGCVLYVKVKVCEEEVWPRVWRRRALAPSTFDTLWGSVAEIRAVVWSVAAATTRACSVCFARWGAGAGRIGARLGREGGERGVSGVHYVRRGVHCRGACQRPARVEARSRVGRGGGEEWDRKSDWVNISHGCILGACLRLAIRSARVCRGE